MATLTEPLVASAPAISLPTRGNVNAVNSWTLFTVPAFGSARVETVYLDAAFPDGTQHEESWELTLRALGPVVARIPTGVIGSSTSFISTRLTFARDVAGTSETPPAVVYFPGDTNGTALVTVGIPGIVLPVGSTVELTLYEKTDGGLPAINITGIYVTYTPNAGPVATTSPGDTFPLLLPAE